MPTSTPQATGLPKTGGPSDGSLALIGVVLALAGVLVYRLAGSQQPATSPARDEPESDAK